MGNTFRGYIKLRNQLSGSLDDVRNQLRDKIKAAYNDIFDYLLQVAEKQNVPASVLSDREATIQLKTAPTNILDPPTPPVREKRIRQASLQTRTKLPITNEEDIDRYLEGLRQQIERLLVDHDGVMIIK